MSYIGIRPNDELILTGVLRFCFVDDSGVRGERFGF